MGRGSDDGAGDTETAKTVTFTVAIPATLTSPTPGSKLTGSSATFSWTADGGVTLYEFRLGTTGPGSSNVYNSADATTTALTTGVVSGIPTYGVTLYARLYSWINGAWQYNDYTYTESGSPVAPVLTTPEPGSTLSGASVAFTWTAGGGPTSYELELGSTGVGSSNLYNSGHVTVTTETVSDLPTTGGTVYARLWWEIDAVWKSADYTYTAQ